MWEIVLHSGVELPKDVPSFQGDVSAEKVGVSKVGDKTEGPSKLKCVGEECGNRF